MFGAEASSHHLCTLERHHNDWWALVPGVLLQVQATSSHNTPTLLPRAAQTHTEEACGERQEAFESDEKTADMFSTAQWCLNAIELLQLAGDAIPNEHPVWNGNEKNK